jgi:hypothetical protein
MKLNDGFSSDPPPHLRVKKFHGKPHYSIEMFNHPVHKEERPFEVGRWCLTADQAALGIDECVKLLAAGALPKYEPPKPTGPPQPKLPKKPGED